MHILVLYNIRSVYNVGSLFRSADGAGFEKVYLVGHTPAPIDRFGRARKDFQKTALGAEKTLPWEYVASWKDMLAILQEQNMQSIAIEQDARAVIYTHIALSTSPQRPLALILGNEVDGLSPEVLDHADVIAEIPMMGGKNSLNVCVAGSIVMYDILRRSSAQDKDIE